ncbi:hypothetical protein [Glycomyces sp. NRRL B-16210]|uniref:hypothetical protein n=1 Tax=Glycomyces sp. NRRL B-16210 TaxID=1463821 RepID=UPI0004BF41D9|nr:hypothetical protein [Glycomyces sp. NRRL B-16210]
MRTNLLRRATMVLAAAFAMALAVLMAPAPAHAAWGSQIPVTIQVTGNGHQLGYATGWVQFDTGGTTFRYEITVCRQSSYTPPNLAVSVNPTVANPDGTLLTTHFMFSWTPGGTAPCYGGSEVFTGQHDYSPLNSAYFVLSGNTFVNGNNFTVFTQDRFVSKSYTY